MLVELRIKDFAIIDEVCLTFSPGFNVLTGETGAGKSIIIDAVALLLGGRADTSFVRAGADKARIEGTFRLKKALRTVLDPILEAEGLEGDDPTVLILAREVRTSGRSVCRVNGTTVNRTLLSQVGQPLIDIHGQNEHLGLMQVKEHQRFLDRYANLRDQRLAIAAQMKQLRQIRQELTSLTQDIQRTAQRIDQLTFQVEEIQTANLQPGEEEELANERNRLANAEQIGQLTAELYRILVEGEGIEHPSASDLLGQSTKVAGQLAKFDEVWDAHTQKLDDLIYQFEDFAGLVRDYSESLEFDSGRLKEIEDRLALIFNLKRKYGDTVAEIVDYGEQAQAELETLSNSEERIEALQIAQEKLRSEIGAAALALSEARQAAGERLSQGVVEQLGDLGMPLARFAVDVHWTDNPQGVYIDVDGEQRTVSCDETGIDQIEFLITPNPGEPLKPLIKVASGGETSRVMLALKTVLSRADDTPSLIFDEIDQGIGGRIGGVVGRKLWELGHQGGHQVLCVTHLPQIAGYGDIHFHVSKQVQNGRTSTLIQSLSEDARVEELAQMLGMPSDSTRQSAREILAMGSET